MSIKPLPFERSTLNPDYNIDYRYQADELYKESLLEQDDQDLLPLEDERITCALVQDIMRTSIDFCMCLYRRDGPSSAQP
jgi:hypothetical protein